MRVGNQSSRVGAGFPAKFALPKVAVPLVPVAAVLSAVPNLFTRGSCSGNPPMFPQTWAWLARYSAPPAA